MSQTLADCCWRSRCWLLAGERQDGNALHAELLRRLAVDLSGKDARRKTANVLTRVWWRTPAQHAPLCDEALARFPHCHPSDRLILHWGMVLLASISLQLHPLELLSLHVQSLPDFVRHSLDVQPGRELRAKHAKHSPLANMQQALAR